MTACPESRNEPFFFFVCERPVLHLKINSYRFIRFRTAFTVSGVASATGCLKKGQDTMRQPPYFSIVTYSFRRIRYAGFLASPTASRSTGSCASLTGAVSSSGRLGCRFFSTSLM